MPCAVLLNRVDSREISCGLLVLRLLLCEESCERNDIGVDLLGLPSPKWELLAVGSHAGDALFWGGREENSVSEKQKQKQNVILQSESVTGLCFG